MHRADISQPQFEYDSDDPEGYRSGMFRMTRVFGAQDSGTSVYEIPPGQALCPYHYEIAEEEWLLVLQGRATVRTPEGEAELAPMEVAFFPKGRDGAHKVANAGEETLRVMMWSTVVHPSATVYPDSDKIGIWTGGDRSDDLLAPRSAKVDYYYGEK
jgi:uncharacterized cupin superfamily protein